MHDGFIVYYLLVQLCLERCRAHKLDRGGDDGTDQLVPNEGVTMPTVDDVRVVKKSRVVLV